MAVTQSGGFRANPGGGSVFAQAAKILATVKKPAPAKTAAPNPLTNPGVPLSGNTLAQAAQALTNAQTSGPLAELAQQIANQNKQTNATEKLAGGYFNTLGGQAQQGVTDEQGIASNLAQQLQGIAGGTNQQLQGIGDNATQSLLSHSPTGDGGLATPALASLTAEIARQKGLAAQQEGASQAFGANQGANYGGLAASQLGTNALAGTQALKSIAQSGTVKNEPLTQKVADLEASKGSLYATNLGKLRQQEINNQITEQGLGIKQQSIQSANARAAASITGANQRNAATIGGENARSAAGINAANSRAAAQIAAAAKQGNLNRQTRMLIAQQNQQAKKAGKPPVYTPTGQRTLTPVEQQRSFGDIDTIKTLIPQMQAPLTSAAATSLQKAGYNVKEGQKLSEGQIRHLLQTGVHPGGNVRYNPGLVDAAYALAGYGYLTPKQITELNKLGLIVGTRYKRSSGTQNVAAGVGGAAQGVAKGATGIFGA